MSRFEFLEDGDYALYFKPNDEHDETLVYYSPDGSMTIQQHFDHGQKRQDVDRVRQIVCLTPDMVKAITEGIHEIENSLS